MGRTRSGRGRSGRNSIPSDDSVGQTISGYDPDGETILLKTMTFQPGRSHNLRRLTCLAILLVALTPGGVLGHVLSVGHVLIAVRELEIELILRLSLREMTARFFLDRDGDGKVSEAELASSREEILAYLETTVAVTVEGGPLPREVERFGFDTLGGGAPHFVEMKIRFRSPQPLQNYTIRADPLTESGQHRRLYGAIEQRGQWEAFAFYPGAEYRGTRLSFVAHAARFVREGILHIFTGYDHIAFLAGLLLLGGGLFGVLKIVTAFTVAHSITLSAAALQVVVLPSRFVEAGIAFSIVAVAAENLSKRPLVPSRWLVAGFFGLIHGFGFASVLQELHLPTKRLVSSLFFFNSGVEVGQVCIVLLIVPLLRLLARTTMQGLVVKTASALILGLGLFWLYERVL